MAFLLGNQTVGASSEGNAGGAAEAAQFTAGGNGTATSIKVHLSTAAQSMTTLELGIFADSGGSPGSLLASGSTKAGLVSSGTPEVSLGVGLSITSGATYWVGLKSLGGGVSWLYSTGTVAGRFRTIGAAEPLSAAAGGAWTAEGNRNMSIEVLGTVAAQGLIAGNETARNNTTLANWIGSEFTAWQRFTPIPNNSVVETIAVFIKSSAVTTKWAVGFAPVEAESVGTPFGEAVTAGAMVSGWNTVSGLSIPLEGDTPYFFGFVPVGAAVVLSMYNEKQGKRTTVASPQLGNTAFATGVSIPYDFYLTGTVLPLRRGKTPTEALAPANKAASTLTVASAVATRQPEGAVSTKVVVVEAGARNPATVASNAPNTEVATKQTTGTVET